VAAALPRLYAVVDVETSVRRGRTPIDVAEAFLAAGVRLLQLRAKAMGGAELLALADRVQALSRAAGATLIVNDRVDVAAATGAGVHVGQRDLPPEVARRLLGPDAVIGCSTHTRAELDAALAAPVDYVAYGPVFPTTTKTAPDPVVGLDGLRAASARAGAAGRPLVAIGGITLATAPAVIAAGADSVAIIGDLLSSGDEPIAVRTRRFLMALAATPV
jgi:thiamine-phosphate pyrophosphorylase